jgi:hypothetical protein
MFFGGLIGTENRWASTGPKLKNKQQPTKESAAHKPTKRGEKGPSRDQELFVLSVYMFGVGVPVELEQKHPCALCSQ